MIEQSEVKLKPFSSFANLLQNKTFIVVIVNIILSLITIKYIPIPFVYVTLLWIMCLLFLTIKTNNQIVKSVYVNLAVIVFAFLAVESFLIIKQKIKGKQDVKKYHQKNYSVTHDLLGYAPRKNNRSKSFKKVDGKIVYNVVYTTDKDGLRVSPNVNENVEKCILFFGGSYTYGEGVKDEESLPSQVGIKRTDYKIYNFGFHGYGPHQMMAALRHEIVDSIVKYEPAYIIYQAIPAHIMRVAGKNIWSTHDPKYIVRGDGLVYDGHFDKDVIIPSRLYTSIIFQLNKSYTYRKFFKHRILITDQDVQLYQKLLLAIDNDIKQRYPEAEFHIIMGQGQNSYFKATCNLLRKHNLNIHLIGNILKSPPDHQSYHIKHDGHPTALAYREIADYVLDHIIK